MGVKFPKDNKLIYCQDFGFWRGVPSGIEFEATDCDTYYILRGKGYGTKDYGNGALSLYKKQEFPFDIKDFDVDGSAVDFNENEWLKSMVEQLIEAGNVLSNERMSNLHIAFSQKWDNLVTEYIANKDKGVR